MHVTVNVHSTALRLLALWRRRIIQSPTGGPAMADLLWEELLRELARTGGMPAGAVGDTSVDPSQWRWRFSSDTEVLYEMTRRPATFFRAESRNIVIRSIRLLP